MNKWISISVAIILTAGIAVNGVLYIQESGKLKDAQAQISALEGNYNILEGDFTLLDNSLSALEGGLSTMRDDFSSLEGDVSSVQDGVSSVQDGVSSLEGDVSSLEGDVSSLEGDVSSLEGDVSSVQDGVSSLEGDVDTLDDKVSTVEGGVSALAGNVSSLAGDVSSVLDDISALEAHDRAVMDVVAMVAPSVVRIETYEGDGWYGEGSGVIITNDGWVLTNRHVVEYALSIEIILMDGETFNSIDVSDIQIHDFLDIAIVKIDSNRTDFPAATLGSSADITVGEQVVAIGFPFWPEISDQPTITTGIVSAVQTFADNEATEMFGGLTDMLGDGLWIQTDTAINHGNSGGPLINLKGEVIGINTLGFKDWGGSLWEGISFSIPIDEIQPFPEEVTG